MILGVGAFRLLSRPVLFTFRHVNLLLQRNKRNKQKSGFSIYNIKIKQPNYNSITVFLNSYPLYRKSAVSAVKSQKASNSKAFVLQQRDNSLRCKTAVCCRAIQQRSSLNSRNIDRNRDRCARREKPLQPCCDSIGREAAAEGQRDSREFGVFLSAQTGPRSGR